MKQIGNYTVEETPLGRGGMGQVLRGYTPAGVQVAIKEILPQFVSDVEFRARIEKEIQFLKNMHHDNVVKIYDHFELGGNLYIVMELVEGNDVEQYVTDKGPIEWKEAVNYMIKLLHTMQYVHEHGIVHRDIKPGNIMIRENGDICLLDFGVAKDINNSHGGTVVGTIIGTSGYMSPEQAQGLSIDWRSDVYALGCVLYFMLTGQHAFGNNMSEYAMQKAISEDKFPRLADSKKNLPSKLQKILDGATDKNMMRRFQSCREFADNLRTLVFDPDGPGTISSQEGQFIKVGREGCDLLVGDDIHRRVSRHHADIHYKRFTGGEFYVFTDTSANGTTIDGHELSRGMSFNIPKGQYPLIILGNDPECVVDMHEVERIFDEKYTGTPVSKSSKKDSKKNNAGRGSREGNKLEEDNSFTPSSYVSFIGAIKSCFMKYADFSGRASRSEYWWFYLFNFFVNAIFVVLAMVLEEPKVLYFSYLYALIILLPNLAVLVRRFHDTGRSALNLLWFLLPFFGGIIIFIFTLIRGEKKPNKYGRPPVYPK